MGRYLRAALVAGVMLAAAPGSLAQDGGVNSPCIAADMKLAENNFDGAIADLRACLSDTTRPRLALAVAQAQLVMALKQTDRTDEFVAELRAITSSPVSEWSEFRPPTLAMDKMRAGDIYAGITQPALLLELATVLANTGRIPEALDAVNKSISVSRATNADMMADEAAGWFARGVLLREIGDGAGSAAAMMRAYVRGADHIDINRFLDLQSEEARAGLAELRASMTEHLPKVAYRRAWQASLGETFNPLAPDIAVSVKAVADVEAQEEVLAGPIPF